MALSACSSGYVVLAIFETVVNAASVGKFYLEDVALSAKSCKARLSIKKFAYDKKVLNAMNDVLTIKQNVMIVKC